MENLGTWDLVLLSGAGFIAVTTLVRLMQRQRKVVLQQLQTQVELEQAAKAAEERKAKKLAAAAAAAEANKKTPKRAA